MRKYSSDNNNLAIDVCDPTGIQALQKINQYNLSNAQIITESARSIKSEDEIMCLRASIKVAEIGIQKMHKNLIAGITEEELWAHIHKINIHTMHNRNMNIHNMYIHGMHINNIHIRTLYVYQ